MAYCGQRFETKVDTFIFLPVGPETWVHTLLTPDDNLNCFDGHFTAV